MENERRLPQPPPGPNNALPNFKFYFGLNSEGSQLSIKCLQCSNIPQNEESVWFCSICQKIICSRCYQQLRLPGRNCSSCLQPDSFIRISGLSFLQVHCLGFDPNNNSFMSCPKTFPLSRLGELKAHCEECPKAFLNCPLCFAKVVKTEIGSHVAHCQTQRVKCGICNNEFLPHEINNHRDQCSKQVIEKEAEAMKRLIVERMAQTNPEIARLQRSLNEEKEKSTALEQKIRQTDALAKEKIAMLLAENTKLTQLVEEQLKNLDISSVAPSNSSSISLEPQINWNFVQKTIFVPAKFSVISHSFPIKGTEIMSCFGLALKDSLSPNELTQFMGDFPWFFGFSLFPLMKFSNGERTKVLDYSSPKTIFKEIHCQILSNGEFLIMSEELSITSWKTIFKMNLRGSDSAILVGAIRAGNVEIKFI